MNKMKTRYRLTRRGIRGDKFYCVDTAIANSNAPATTAKLLGFTVSDVHILMAMGRLTPLDDPSPNAPIWFCAVEIIRLAVDHDWLHKATKEIAKFWRNKRERRMKLQPANLLV